SAVSILGNTGGTTRVELNGASAGAGADGLTLAAGSDGSLIRGLAINRFGGVGLRILTAGNSVEACYIGTDSSGGPIFAGNAGGGVLLTGSAAKNNVIGGTSASARSLISHNGTFGVSIDAAASQNKVQGCFLGTDAG